MKSRKVRAAIVVAFGTQADFAVAAGLQPAKVSMVLNGRRKLTSGEAERWAGLLRCGMDVLGPFCEERS